jgi:hypothetical protein
LFPEEDLASPIERSQRGFDVELLPSSKIAQQIKYHGVDKVETYLQDLISQKVGGVGVRVNIMEPETEEPAGKLLDVYNTEYAGDEDAEDMEEDECGFCSKDSHKHTKTNPVGEDEEGYDAQATLVLPMGNVTVTFRKGVIVDLQSDDADVEFNIDEINKAIKSGIDIEEAIQRYSHYSNRKPVMDSVISYMSSVKQGEYVAPVILETTREKYRPKTNHQILEYMERYGK